MNNNLIENIKIKSDLQYDFLFESKEYHALDSENKIFLKECYDMGVNQSIYLHQQDKALLESIDEGLWDRFKAGAARVGQGLKNVSGIGTPTADSKDAGVDSLLNSFKTKWAKAPKAQTPPASGNNPIIAPIVNNVNQNIAQIASASATSTTPPPTPQQANVIVQQSNAPIALKTKIANLIRANPGKTKFLLGILSFGAGIAAAAATAGNPIAAKVAAGIVGGLGNAAIAKIQGRGTGDVLMAGVGGGFAGQAIGGLGASALSSVSSMFSNAATTAVDATTDGFADTSDGNSPEVQVTQQQSAVSPEDLRTADTESPDTGYADTSDANSPEYQATQQQSAVSPEDQSLSDTEAPDTNQYDAQGNRIDTQQQFADTSDGNSPETQVTQQQSAVSPEDLRTADTEAPDTEFADTSDRNSPETQSTQQQVANTAQGATQPRFKSALDPRSARVAFDKSRGAIKEETMFVKSYNNTYTLKKSLNENIEEKWNESAEETIDEALSPEQTKIYNEFLKDLGKSFKKPSGEVIEFMQSQGDRFKNVLDFLNAEVNPSISGAQPAAPGGGAQPAAPGGGAQPAAPGGGAQPAAPGGGAQPAAPGGGAQPAAPGGGAQPAAPGGGAQPTAPGGGVTPPGTTPPNGTTPPSGLTKELQSKLDVIITPDFLSGLVIQYPLKIRDSKLQNNKDTLLSAKSLTKISLKISKDTVLGMLIQCQINNTTVKFETAFKSSDLIDRRKNLFEINFDESSSVDIFKRKLSNALAIEFSKNPALSGGKSNKELSTIILSYLNPKITDTVRKMVQSISLTAQEVSRLIGTDDIVYMGVSKNGIKFVKEKSSTEEKPVQKQEDKPEEKPVGNAPPVVKAPSVDWKASDPGRARGDGESGRQDENKLFESINRKNKNIFKLR